MALRHNRIFISGAAVLLALAGGAAASGTAAAQAYSQQDIHFKAPGVPRQVVFAGDTVRFNRSDLYERMDRELISFT